MNHEEQIVDLVERFLKLAEQLLKDERIDYSTYKKITCSKKEFLKEIKEQI